MKKSSITFLSALILCGCAAPSGHNATTVIPNSTINEITPNQINGHESATEARIANHPVTEKTSISTATRQNIKELTQESPWPSEQGVATYYASEMEGRTTASGEAYDPEELTAAHRTIPLGSNVRVTNLKTGQHIVVRINDRWGGGGDRIINLSKQAAVHLNFGSSGMIPVRLDIESIAPGNTAQHRNTQQLPVRLESSDAKTHSRSQVCENEAEILGLTGEFFRNHVTTCLSRSQ
ncbi:MAG: septal ring lytic transglycosylase RlpA family protein [Nitrosomonas sp.]|nr:MAG: septal ring lytic transglycosylase RlpA family protein [Nitrosomonas sp.]